MTTQICPTPTSQYSIFQGNDQEEQVSSSRYCINWDKVIVFANSALIVAGIAAGFFMKMPLLILGLGAYGTLYLLLKPLSDRQKAQIEEDRRSELKENVKNLEEEAIKLDERINRIRFEIIDAKRIRGERLSPEQLGQIADRSIKVAHGIAAQEWLKRETPIAERDNPELHKKFKELGKAMVDAGRAIA